jgi:hypothetical protein
MKLSFPSTTGPIARHFGEELFRVDYAIKTRGINPVAKIVPCFVYDEAAVNAIGNALREIRARRRPRHNRPPAMGAKTTLAALTPMQEGV